MKSQKQNRHSLMAKGIMVLLSLLVLIFIFTFAWFLDPHTPAVASGLRFRTSTEVNYDIAIGFESPYTSGHYVVTDFMSAGSINFEDITVPRTVQVGDNTVIQNEFYGEHINLFEDFNAVDLTGDGVKLYRPEMRANNRYIDYDKSKVDYNITDNLQYITFDIYVRSKSNSMSASLSDGSYVIAACELGDYSLQDIKDKIANGELTAGADAIDASKLKANVTYRKSKYGVAVQDQDFSEDSVVGAVRTSFTQYKNYQNLSTLFTAPEKLANGASYASVDYQLNADTSKLWIPRTDVYLQDTTTTAENDWILKTNKDTGSTYQNSVVFNDPVMRTVYGNVTYEQAAKLHRYYDDDKIREAAPANRFSSVDNPITNLSTQTETVISVDSNMHDTVDHETCYYGKCRVKLWIEGCDAEARRAIDGGSFFFGLELKSSN